MISAFNLYTDEGFTDDIHKPLTGTSFHVHKTENEKRILKCIIIEQSLEFQSPQYLLFVDYQKALNSVDRRWIWKALEERGLPNEFIKLIQEGYNQFSCTVLHNGQLTTPFETKSGVRQGCLLSPLLFLVVLYRVLRASLDGKARGICWKLTETLEDLNYADDICLLSHSQAHMQSKLNNLCYESKKAGLKNNFSKTEELRVNTKSQRSIMLANKAMILHTLEVMYQKMEEHVRM
jgi:hypothetical protein